jgi:XisI protein
MDKLELYRSIVTEILTKYSQYKPSYGQVEIEQIFDCDRDSPVGDAPRTISITRDRLESTTKNLWHDDLSRYSG